MTPALIPNPDTYVEDLVDNVKNGKKTFTSFNGQVQPTDHFANIKNTHSLDKNRHRGSIIDVFGCHACRWINTEMCPHKGDVTHLKHHANGICSQRLIIPKQLHDEGVKMTGKQMLQVRGLMDAEYFSKYVQDEALNGKRDINDVFPWEKLKADILKDMRKQDEGSKLTVKKETTPTDISNLIRNSKTVDVEIKDKSESNYDNLDEVSPNDES